MSRPASLLLVLAMACSSPTKPTDTGTPPTVPADTTTTATEAGVALTVAPREDTPLG